MFYDIKLCKNCCLRVWRQNGEKMVVFALLWSMKIEKMADFCGLAGGFVPSGAVSGGFLGSGWVIVGLKSRLVLLADVNVNKRI